MAEGEKYPPRIQKLFTPKLPFLYKKPLGYYPEERRTARITPLRDWKLHVTSYKKEYSTKLEIDEKLANALPKKETPSESKDRQLKEWQDTEAFSQNEFLKDPYRTVFVARLPYSVTELDVSKAFSQYGGIELIRVVRDTVSGSSRGYAFVVFEAEPDAKNCIRELAPTGILVKSSDNLVSRKALVDMERGRLVRNWLPRRLGGGLGGRHYTQPSTSHLREASAAASGRRTNLSQNPYQNSDRGDRDRNDRSSGASSRPIKRQATDRYGSSFRGNNSYSDSRPAQALYASLPYTPTTTAHSVLSVRGSDLSIKSKYAKYSSGTAGTRDGDRDLRERDLRIRR